MSKEGIKTEHGGGKKGQGFWGRRKVAKQVSKKVRRERDAKQCQKAISEPQDD